MTLTLCHDLSPADWIVHADLAWQRLVCFGPAAFDSYARLRFLPDPVRAHQSENDVEAGRRSDQMPTLLEVLATETATPDHCYFLVWEGFASSTDVAPDTHPGARPEADAVPGVAPDQVAPQSIPTAPKVVVPHRAYWLFRGRLVDVGTWDTADGWSGGFRLGDAEAAFIWPADHAWCVAKDVDPHWAGIGGSGPLITRLTTDARLDVVPADPTSHQSFYS